MERELDDFAKLYETVLIDTPVGGYFLRFLEAEVEVKEGGEMDTKLAQERFREYPEFLGI